MITVFISYVKYKIYSLFFHYWSTLGDNTHLREQELHKLLDT